MGRPPAGAGYDLRRGEQVTREGEGVYRWGRVGSTPVPSTELWAREAGEELARLAGGSRPWYLQVGGVPPAPPPRSPSQLPGLHTR